MPSWTKLFVPAFLALGASFANAESPGRDYDPFVTIQGYQRSEFTEHRFDEAQFLSNDKGTKTTVDGHLTIVRYGLADETYGGEIYLRKSLQEQLDEQLKKFPKTQILYNTNECTQDNPWAPLFTIRFENGNIPVWVQVDCTYKGYRVIVLEEQAFHH